LASWTTREEGGPCCGQTAGGARDWRPGQRPSSSAPRGSVWHGSRATVLLVAAAIGVVGVLSNLVG